MDQITLKNTDLRVSRICFGTMTFGGQTGEEVASRMIGLCRENGVNFLDTANAYNRGASEEMLGRLLVGRLSGAAVSRNKRKSHKRKKTLIDHESYGPF